MPNRAESCRGLPNDIISIAQQARPNVAGHIEDLRVQPANLLSEVSRTPDGSFSSIPISVPIQSATAPLVDERHRDQEEERHHRDEAEQAEMVEPHRPRVQEHDLDVEDDE